MDCKPKPKLRPRGSWDSNGAAGVGPARPSVEGVDPVTIRPDGHKVTVNGQKQTDILARGPVRGSEDGGLGPEVVGRV